MGSFSWTKADRLTKVANIVEGRPFKMLIPQEFGGGYIKDHYQGYGKIGHKDDLTPQYDMHELLAFWNAEGDAREKLRYDGEYPMMKEIDHDTVFNRSIGIGMGVYERQIEALKYPLKLVSASYRGTYEECDGHSYFDPNQGLATLSWDERDAFFEARKAYLAEQDEVR